MRTVREEGRVPKKEGRVRSRAAAHEVERRRHGLAPDVEAHVSMSTAASRVPVGHPLAEATALAVALPPLARLQALIAERAQEIRQRLGRGDQLEHLLAGDALRRVVPRDPVLVRIEARDDRGQTRPAKGGRHVASRKGAPLRRQRVKARRLDGLVTHEAEVRPRLVIGDQEQDIGAPGGARDLRRLTAHGERGARPEQGCGDPGEEARREAGCRRCLSADRPHCLKYLAFLLPPERSTATRSRSSSTFRPSTNPSGI